MTKQEFDEMAALVVRLRKELEDATQDLSLHYDALKQSNAQCGEYLRHNEMLRAELDRISAERDTMQTKLHSELVEVRAALASVTEQRDSLKRTLDEWERADTKPHERIEPPLRMGLVSAGGPVYIHDDVADHVVPPVLPFCAKCHGCGSALGVWCPGLRCHNQHCERTATGAICADLSPHYGPCKSATPVRHE